MSKNFEFTIPGIASGKDVSYAVSARSEKHARTQLLEDMSVEFPDLDISTLDVQCVTY